MERSESDKGWRRAAALCASLAISWSGCAAEQPMGDTTRIGALLPFTGALATSGSNIERTLIWVTEQLNDAGGLGGRDVELISCDSNSSVTRGLACGERLLDAGVVGIIGPEYDDLALELLPLITDDQVVAVSGGVSSPVLSDSDAAGYWFRTFPSALSLGSVLAERMAADGHGTAVLLYVDDVYGNGLSSMVEREYEARGGTVLAAIPLPPGPRSHNEQVSRAVSLRPDAVVLIAYEQAGATVVNEAAALGAEFQWYFSHTLHSAFFARNVGPGILDGMGGVAPAVPEAETLVFPEDVADRWPGERPLIQSYFSYDALAVLALAYEEAYVAGGSVEQPTADEISVHMRAVSADSLGRRLAWYELGEGLSRVRAGNAINYRGVSGGIDFDENGDVPAGLVQLWEVAEGQIVDTEIVLASPISSGG